MNDSIANTLRNAPRERSDEVLIGMCQQPVPGHLEIGDVVAGHRVAGGAHRPGRRAVRGGDIGLAARPGGSARAAAARRRCPGRPMKPLLHTSCRQVWIRPPASSPADSRASMADPNGAHDISSPRDHITRTGPPGHRPGQQHRVGGHVVGAVVPVGARALDVVHGHLPGRQPQARRPAPRAARTCPGCVSTR